MTMEKLCSGQRKNTLRQVLAYLLWLMPLFSCPLVWLRPVYGKLPLWGDVLFISSHVTGIIAAAIILLFPERVKNVFSKPLPRVWLIAVMVSGALAVANHILFPGNPAMLLAATQTLFLPIAGVALSPELRRAAIPCGAVTCIILLFFTITGDKFLTGFTGNWNWNFTMICATIPALTAWIIPKKHPFIIATIINVVLMTVVVLCFPELAPRGTIAALILTALIAPAIRKISRERRPTALVGVALAIGFLFFSAINAPVSSQVNDSRFQLWRSSVAMAKKHLFTGCGTGRFEQAVRHHMTKEYFFTEYAATRHPHPHNELIFYISEFGIAGAVMFILFCGCALKYTSHKNDYASRWLIWLFLLLLLHGQVDVLLSTPLAGSYFLLAGGALAARGTRKTQVKAATLRKTLSVILFICAAVFAVNIFIATSHLRNAKLLIREPQPLAALEQLSISLKKFPVPEARYIAANILLFDLKQPAAAITQLLKLEHEICGGFHHSYGVTARALTALGKFDSAKEYFALEREAFPYSALYAGYELAMLELSQAPAIDIKNAHQRLIRNLELRNFKLSDIPMLKNAIHIDDEPLKWSKLK